MPRETVKAIVSLPHCPAWAQRETSLYYYRARHYDPNTGRFLREDLERFAAGQNFYSYVTSNSVNRKDPLGLWQITIGGGEGLGGLLTIGHNSGQWNFGLYSGGGVGLFGRLDQTDSGGCRKFGAHGAVTIQAEAGLPYYLSTGLEFSVNGGSSEPNINGEVTVGDVGGISWNLNKPHQPEHSILYIYGLQPEGSGQSPEDSSLPL